MVNTPSFNLKLERLKQYCSMHTPVFLVVADVSNNKGYWLFVQKYADRMVDQSWRNRDSGKVALRVPTGNLITDSGKLIDAVRESIRYMASKMIQHGIEHQEEYYGVI